ncbi:MAG: hypothetical protein J5I47_12675 [Vicingus serpentipes]|nr:hypothetical protein [Vicingus serpentipes]
MQKILIALVLTLIYNVSFACDLCTIYIGLRPNDFKNNVGLRHRYRIFEKEYQFQSISEIGNGSVLSGKGIPVDKHGGGDATSVTNGKYIYQETFNSYDVSANIYLTRKLQLNVSTYFADNYILRDDSVMSNIGGIGDVNLLFKYQLYNSQATGDTLLKNRFLHRVTVGAGGTLPTGNYNKETVVDFETDIQPNVILGTPIMELDPHLQAGTGSFNYLFLLEYLMKFNRFGLHFNTSYKLNTTNKNKFRFANRFNMNETLFALFPLSKKVKLMPQTGLSYELSGRDEYKNLPFYDSGGEVLFSNVGVNLFINQLSLEFTYYHPIYQKLYGDQPLNSQRMISQINYYF